MPARVPSFISTSNIRLKIANLIRKREKFDAISLSFKISNGPPVTYKHSTDIGVKQHTFYFMLCLQEVSGIHNIPPSLSW